MGMDGCTGVQVRVCWDRLVCVVWGMFVCMLGRGRPVCNFHRVSFAGVNLLFLSFD